jgi:hypothetical protein
MSPTTGHGSSFLRKVRNNAILGSTRDRIFLHIYAYPRGLAPVSLFPNSNLPLHSTNCTYPSTTLTESFGVNTLFWIENIRIFTPGALNSAFKQAL